MHVVEAVRTAVFPAGSSKEGARQGERITSCAAVQPSPRRQATALSLARAASPAWKLSVAWCEADLGNTTTDITMVVMTPKMIPDIRVTATMNASAQQPDVNC